MLASVLSRLSRRYLKSQRARPRRVTTRRLGFEGLEGRRVLSTLGFTLSALPATATAGVVEEVTVTAPVPTYTGTITFSTSDKLAHLPLNLQGLPSYTFTTADNGTHTFKVTFKTVGSGSQTLTVTDSASSAATGKLKVPVTPGPMYKFDVTGLPLPPATYQAGTPGTITVTAVDKYGNTETNYAGTVHFASSDKLASLPADSHLTKGTQTFSVTLNSGGLTYRSITVTDNSTPPFKGTEKVNVVGSVGVVVGPLDHFNVILAPTDVPPVTVGVSTKFVATAMDKAGHTITSYQGVVQVTDTSDPTFVPFDVSFAPLPPPALPYKGKRYFDVKFHQTGLQTLTVTDTGTNAIIGSIQVNVQ